MREPPRAEAVGGFSGEQCFIDLAGAKEVWEGLYAGINGSFIKRGDAEQQG
jgi:hypothetical protein